MGYFGGGRGYFPSTPLHLYREPPDRVLNPDRYGFTRLPFRAVVKGGK
ncbi:MAG: hypothetical protein AB7S54_09650 [Bacteroidales bacterium]